MKSNLEAKNIDEFLDIAKLSQKKYDVLNEQVVLQNLNTGVKEIDNNQFNKVFLNNVLKNTDIKLYETKPLQIPKRPLYEKDMPAKEFERLEREAFLNWRRSLASEEERCVGYSITPFEKNIEVWRQLWIVVEKCNTLIQIVDGRNPLYYRCPDLESYIKSISKDKDNVLLVNKADLMSKSVRLSWAKYFKENNINYVFFSALKEKEKIEEMESIEVNVNVEKIKENLTNLNEDQLIEENENIQNKFKNLKIHQETEDLNNVDSTIENKDHKVNLIENKQIITESNKNTENIKIEIDIDNKLKETNNIKSIEKDNKQLEYTTEEENSIKIYNREELIKLIEDLNKDKPKHKTGNCHYIGFIGYPNVGKSSVINVLMQKKKVAVAMMPGKTKHYQTLFLPEHRDICLMDCPGLVFPSFSSSKADMLVNGILPIDTLREYHSAIGIIVKKIPKRILASYYKIKLPDIYSATQFLQVLATKRGYFSGRNLPDEAKTSKLVLKDYVNGRLLYCNLRPDYDETLHGLVINYQTDDFVENDIITEEDIKNQEIIKEIPADFDDNYEKIDIDVENKKISNVNDNNFDFVFFENDVKMGTKNNKITKDMMRALKFAMKRGQVKII